MINNEIMKNNEIKIMKINEIMNKWKWRKWKWRK